MRVDGRQPDEKRPVTIETDFVRTAYGSCLIATGNTRVICTASVEEAVPPFLRDKGQATGSDGCNNFFMNWEGEGENITFQPGGATLRLCPNGAEQAQKMLQMFPSVESWNISDGQLELRSEDKVTAVFEAVEM